MEKFEEYKSEAMNLIQNYKSKKVREMINSEEDLKALASYASEMIELPFEQQLLHLDAEITRLEKKINNTTDYELYNLYVKKYNRLVKQAQQLVSKIKELKLPCGVEIGGGIDLEPGHFSIKVEPIKKLEKFIKIAEQAKTSWNQIDGSGEWIRSRAEPDISDLLDWAEELIEEIDWGGGSESKSDSLNYIYYAGGKNQNYWLMLSKTRSWIDLLELGKGIYRERIYNSKQKKIQIINFESGELKSYILGERFGKRIVFSESHAKELAIPKEPPTWWIKK